MSPSRNRKPWTTWGTSRCARVHITPASMGGRPSAPVTFSFHTGLGRNRLRETNHHAAIAEILGPTPEARVRRDNARNFQVDRDAHGGSGVLTRLPGQELLPCNGIGLRHPGEPQAHQAWGALGRPDHHRLGPSNKISREQAEVRRRALRERQDGLDQQPALAHIPRDPERAIIAHHRALAEYRHSQDEA